MYQMDNRALDVAYALRLQRLSSLFASSRELCIDAHLLNPENRSRRRAVRRRRDG